MTRKAATLHQSMSAPVAQNSTQLCSARSLSPQPSHSPAPLARIRARIISPFSAHMPRNARRNASQPRPCASSPHGLLQLALLQLASAHSDHGPRRAHVTVLDPGLSEPHTRVHPTPHAAGTQRTLQSGVLPHTGEAEAASCARNELPRLRRL